MIKNKIFKPDHKFIIKYYSTLLGNQKKEYLKVPKNIQLPLLFIFVFFWLSQWIDCFISRAHVCDWDM